MKWFTTRGGAGPGSRAWAASTDCAVGRPSARRYHKTDRLVSQWPRRVKVNPTDD